MEYSKQEYWSGLPFPSPGDLCNPGIEPASPVSPSWQVDSLPLALLGKSQIQAYQGDIVGLVPDYCNKVNVVIEQVTKFWFPSAYKSYVCSIL